MHPKKYTAWIVVKRHCRDFSAAEERKGTAHYIRGQILFSYLREDKARDMANRLARASAEKDTYNFWAMPHTAY